MVRYVFIARLRDVTDMTFETFNLENFNIISFDIFDTVVTRITLEPVGIFLRMQQKLAAEPDIPLELQCNFADARIKAERAARRKKVREDICLEDIYHELGLMFRLEEIVLYRLISLEIDIEVDSIRAVPMNARRVAELREKGKRIIFISDMYLPTMIIRKILEKAGVLSDEDGIYVSGEYGLTKSSGRLYLDVLHRERSAPEKMLHIGDNHRSDYRKARDVGKIAAYHYDEGRFSRVEKILHQADVQENALDWQLVAGASRVARLHSVEYVDVHHKTLYEIGANVAGPVLWGFVAWVLERAIAQKRQRLYFVARDGQILYQIAQAICKSVGYDIDLRYLYGSRQAWHLAGLTRITSDDLHWILLKDPFLNLRLVATRIGLPVEVFKSYLVEAGFPVRDTDEELDSTLVTSLKTIMLQSVPVQGAVLNEAKRRRSEVIAFLRQEGLCDAVSWALVDSGWKGRAQQSLTKILQHAGWHGTPHGFYLGLVSVPNPPASGEAYLFSPYVPVAHMKWCSMMLNLLELLMSADHGTTLSYREDREGAWHPVLAASSVDLHGEYGIAALRQGIARFLEHLEMPLVHLDHKVFCKKSIAILKQLYLSPSREIAAALGRIPFSTDQTDCRLLDFAPKLTLLQSLRFITTFSRRERFSLTFWAHGSRMQSAWSANMLLWLWCQAQQTVSFFYEVARKAKLFFLGSRV